MNRKTIQKEEQGHWRLVIRSRISPNETPAYAFLGLSKTKSKVIEDFPLEHDNFYFGLFSFAIIISQCTFVTGVCMLCA